MLFEYQFVFVGMVEGFAFAFVVWGFTLAGPRLAKWMMGLWGQNAIGR